MEGFYKAHNLQKNSQSAQTIKTNNKDKQITSVNSDYCAEKTGKHATFTRN